MSLEEIIYQAQSEIDSEFDWQDEPEPEDELNFED